MHIGFVAGLNDRKLSQKLAPLQAMPEVTRISLFRRQPFFGEKVQWHPLPAFVDLHPLLGDLWRMMQLLYRGSECDLLVGCHQRFHGLMVALAGKILKVPTAQLIITDFDLMWGHPAFRWAIRQAVVVGLRGQKAKKSCLSKLSPELPLLFIPPNVLPPPLPKSEPTATKRDIDVLFVGSFTEDKNIPLLAKILEGIKDSRSRLEAYVIGEGPELKRFQTHIKKEGLSKEVTILEMLPYADLEGFYRRAKLLLLPSRAEGFPMVIPEAMGWGTPVVASDVGGIGDLVISDKTGFLVASGNCEGFIAACEKILEDQELADQLAVNARIAHDDFVAASSLEAGIEQWRKALSVVAPKKRK
ncbi:MAG: glycosyltransferase family 4 protein [Magnetococcales bacterium]|nr:glycosyltransferase family 4 protein [Magnetococcales bacterium]